MEVEEEEEGRGTGCTHCGCLLASRPDCAVLSFFCSHRGLSCPRMRFWVDVCCLGFHLAPGWSQCALQGAQPCRNPWSCCIGCVASFHGCRSTRRSLGPPACLEQGTLICCLLLSVFWHRKSSSMPVNTWLRELSRVKRGGYSLSSLEKKAA